MILHSLRVANWRSLLNPVELGPFSDRLNVIHAPNGTGKSSLFEAMRRSCLMRTKFLAKRLRPSAHGADPWLHRLRWNLPSRASVIGSRKPFSTERPHDCFASRTENSSLWPTAAMPTANCEN